MAQDTRKDPRAKVLSMTVRYKSATVDEFIEHHSHDVSRGGIFIKTPSPFPPGTLLKFEIRIQDEQAVLAGVGRVVWKREPGDGPAADQPSGMGVKFIKLDDKSKALIAKLVDAQQGQTSTYEAGKAQNGAPDAGDPAPEAKPEAKPEPPKPEPRIVPRKGATMLGLGAIGASKAEPSTTTEKAVEKKVEKRAEKPAEKPAEASFFPETNPEKDMPPPEERTVMKQAAELLKQALGEVGSSIEDDIAAPAGAPKIEPVPVPAARSERPQPAKAADVDAEKPTASAAAALEKAPAPTPAADKPAAVEAPKPKVSDRPKPKEEPEIAAKPPLPVPEEGGSGGRLLMYLLIGACLAIAGWLLLGRGSDKLEAPPAPTAAATTTTKAPEAATAAAPTASASATAVASASGSAPPAAPTASASAAASAPPPAASASAAVAKPDTAKPAAAAAPPPAKDPAAAPPPAPKPPAPAAPAPKKPVKGGLDDPF